jgi:Glycosyltransferase 61
MPPSRVRRFAKSVAKALPGSGAPRGWSSAREAAGADYRQVRRSVVRERSAGTGNATWASYRDAAAKAGMSASARVTDPEVFIATFERARLVGPRAAVVAADGRLVLDLSREFPLSRPPEAHSALVRARFPRVTQLSGRWATCVSAGTTTYFHWLLDALPRLGLLMDLGCDLDGLVVPAALEDFHHETLDRLGLDRIAQFQAGENLNVRVERLVAPSMPGAPLEPAAWACAWLRETFQADESSVTRRLYVTRRGALRRRLQNEEEIVDLLVEAGFDVVDPAVLTVAEQAKLFASAEIVVAPHGAGLANLVFAPARATVVELLSPHYVNPCYWALSCAVDVRYQFVLGSPDVCDPRLTETEQDILVATDTLARVLDEVAC